MEGTQKPSVIEKVQIAAQRYGIKQLAGEMNKAPSTLYSELNPWGDRSKAKLGFEDALEIMRRTGDYSAMVEACAEAGLIVVMHMPVADKDTVEKEKVDDIKSLAAFHGAIANGESGGTIHTLAGRTCDEIMQTAQLATSGNVRVSNLNAQTEFFATGERQ